jgi:hypothetical protein
MPILYKLSEPENNNINIVANNKNNQQIIVNEFLYKKLMDKS